MYEKCSEKNFSTICGAYDISKLPEKVIVQNNTKHEIIIRKNERVMSVTNYEHAVISGIHRWTGKLMLKKQLKNV